MEITGEEGEQITIQCDHVNAYNNVKYFCKQPCRDEDVLIRSRDWKDNSNGKYSINDKGNTFYVTISRLTKKDQGDYKCGIDRVGIDTSNKVKVIIIDGEFGLYVNSFSDNVYSWSLLSSVYVSRKYEPQHFTMHECLLHTDLLFF